MADDNTETDEVRIVCEVATDAETLSKCLYGNGLFGLPGWVGRYGRLADGTPVSLAGSIYRDNDSAGRHLLIRSNTIERDPLTHEVTEPRRRGYAIDIAIGETEAGSCRLSARSETWCATTLFYILIRGSEYPGIFDAVIDELPDLADVAGWDPPIDDYHEVTFYVNSDIEFVSKWLIRFNDSYIEGYEAYEADGGGFSMIGASEYECEFVDRLMQVSGWLVCKHDARGIRAGLIVTHLLTFYITSLSAQRCKVEAHVTEERFAECYATILDNFADDYPETRAAMIAAGVPIETSPLKPTRKRARTKSADPRAVVAKFNADWAAGKVDTLEAWAAREGIAYKTLSRYRAEVNGETGLQD